MIHRGTPRACAPRGSEDIDFWVDFLATNSNKLQNLGLEGKIGWLINVFTLLNLEIFSFENVKNQKWVHTWANSTGYTSLEINNWNEFWDFFFFKSYVFEETGFWDFYHGTKWGCWVTQGKSPISSHPSSNTYAGVLLLDKWVYYTQVFVPLLGFFLYLFIYLFIISILW
jgi:hypothetical protein